jgi:hypothetical protein
MWVENTSELGDLKRKRYANIKIPKLQGVRGFYPKNMIEMKYKFGWILFSFCIFPIVLLGIITYVIWNDLINPKISIATAALLVCCVLTLEVLFLSWFPNLVLKLKNLFDPFSKYNRNNKLLTVIAVIPILLLFYVMEDNVDLSKDYLIDQKFPPSIIIFLALIILSFRWVLQFKIIFNDNGITIGKNAAEIPWSAVRKVDYDFHDFCIGFSFEYTQNGKIFFQCINYMFANRKEGIEFAFRKIAEHNIANLVITQDAKTELMTLKLL